MSSIKERLHLYYQDLLLSIPRLSELCLATGKTLGFLRAWHYLARAKVSGDYLEFGVYRGTSFRLVLQTANRWRNRCSELKDMRFFAFDSFQGLPSPDKHRDSGVFSKDEYSASQREFECTIKKFRKRWNIQIISGFFSDTLTAKQRDKLGLQKVCFINIDCDIYESTMQVLTFITPLLHTGTILFFDDWYFSGGDMTKGEPGACNDWLKENPHIKLVSFGNVGVMGKMFVVNLKEGET